jgi:hypothetical protein
MLVTTERPEQMCLFSAENGHVPGDLEDTTSLSKSTPTLLVFGASTTKVRSLLRFSRYFFIFFPRLVDLAGRKLYHFSNSTPGKAPDDDDLLPKADHPPSPGHIYQKRIRYQFA